MVTITCTHPYLKRTHTIVQLIELLTDRAEFVTMEQLEAQYGVQRLVDIVKNRDDQFTIDLNPIWSY